MEHHYFIINRFDHYYDSVNNKGNAFLAINVFAIGALFTALISLSSYVHSCYAPYILLCMMIMCNVISTLWTLLSLIPFRKSLNKSLIFFGSIGGRTYEVFMHDFKQQTEADIKADLTDQIYILAAGLDKKFERLNIAGKCLFVEAFLLAPLIISVINNLK